MKRYLVYLYSLALILTMLTEGRYTYQVAASSMDGVAISRFLQREYIFSEEEQQWINEAKEALQEILQERTVMALVYLSDTYPIRENPDEESPIVAEVPSGQQVQIQDVAINSPYDVWEKVTFYYQGKEYSGYVERANLAVSDEIFLEWESYYGMNPAARGLMTLTEDGAQVYADVEQFPESYQTALKALKEAHPNWTFVKMNTNLNWNEVVENQMERGRNLIPSSFPDYMWDEIHSPNWAYVTEDSLKYYLDPRNGLTEEYIFQFEQLTYNASYHTEAALQGFLNHTFMAGNVPGTELTYAHTFFKTGEELGVSPFHLACRVYQEQGAGTSALISGTYPGYEGCYNYFNIGASGTTTEEVIITGLERAKKEKWTDADYPDGGGAYYSIHGGAKIISANYILHGQDTLYLQKFDVDSSFDGLYWHQYMQNVCAPTSEGKNIRKSYENAGSLENTFVFKIPVYHNMPVNPCEKPTEKPAEDTTVSYTISLTPPEGYSGEVIYVDGVEWAATVSGADCYCVDVSHGDASTAVMYQYNEKNVPVGMHVWELDHDGKQYQATQVPELNDLLSYHGFSIRITGKSGIRFKTGIAAEVRDKLLSPEGAGGYRLKEYGTLVMNNANRGQYPLIKGGEKVLSGLSYGINAEGVLEDKIYETVDGRHRFTSVLVGLPVSQYKTEFAFRGYAILTKDGEDITIYGPTVWRSIYALSEQILSLGQYPEGSSANVFLKKLISDADNLSTQNGV